MEKQIMILVKALKGTQCPKEEAENVPATMFYRRLIDDGSLVVEIPAAKKTASEPVKK